MKFSWGLGLQPVCYEGFRQVKSQLVLSNNSRTFVEGLDLIFQMSKSFTLILVCILIFQQVDSSFNYIDKVRKGAAFEKACATYQKLQMKTRNG